MRVSMGIAWMVIVAVEMLARAAAPASAPTSGSSTTPSNLAGWSPPSSSSASSASCSTSSSCASGGPSRSRSRWLTEPVDDLPTSSEDHHGVDREGRLEDLPARRHGTQAVLRGVDLEVQPGEFVALIGHSGCGKSTLLNAIGGLLTVDGGTHHARRRAGRRTRARPGHGVPELLAAAPAVAARQRPLRGAGSPAGVGAHARPTPRPSGTCRGRAVGAPRTRSRRRCPAACSSATAVARAFAVEPACPAPRRALRRPRRPHPRRLQAQLIDLWQSESDTEIVRDGHPRHRRGASSSSDRIVVMGNPPGPSIVDVDRGRPAPAP